MVTLPGCPHLGQGVCTPYLRYEARLLCARPGVPLFVWLCLFTDGGLDIDGWDKLNSSWSWSEVFIIHVARLNILARYYVNLEDAVLKLHKTRQHNRNKKGFDRLTITTSFLRWQLDYGRDTFLWPPLSLCHYNKQDGLFIPHWQQITKEGRQTPPNMHKRNINAFLSLCPLEKGH